MTLCSGGLYAEIDPTVAAVGRTSEYAVMFEF
jgi:hypothetical protein